MLSRSIHTYSAPSAPLAGTTQLHRLAAYTGCLRCAYLHMPKRPTTGSELSLMLFRNMSSSETTGNFSAASTQYFTENAGLQLKSKVSAFPLSSHSDSGEGDFSRLYYGSLALRPAALLALLVGADRIHTRPTRTFTSGLPMVWSPAPSPDITTAPTGKLALAGLPPARSSTSFTALTSFYRTKLRRFLEAYSARVVRIGRRFRLPGY